MLVQNPTRARASPPTRKLLQLVLYSDARAHCTLDESLQRAVTLNCNALLSAATTSLASLWLIYNRACIFVCHLIVDTQKYKLKATLKSHNAHTFTQFSIIIMSLAIYLIVFSFLQVDKLKIEFFLKKKFIFRGLKEI